MSKILCILLVLLFQAVTSNHLKSSTFPYEKFSIRYQSGVTVDQEEPSPLIEEGRLPKDVVPVNYNLTIKVYLPDYGATVEESKKLTFEGIVSIRIKNKEPVEKIVLHQKDLNVTNVLVTEQNGRQRKVQSVSDNRLEQLRIHTGPVAPGEHRLQITFKGKMGADGLFSRDYTSADSRTLTAAITQMGPSSARKMVPCWDEPGYKATWNVSIIHPKGSEAISNQIEIKTEELDKDWKITSFTETPVMSSYLLAIGIFNFTHYEGYTNRGMRVRVYISRHHENGPIVLQQTIQCIEGFERQFKIPIPLPKLDMVAVKYFLVAAMENWGLIYFEENYILDNSYESVSTLVHEIAHMWFGNLVTMKGWDIVYLKEGLADLMAYEGLKYVDNGKFDDPMAMLKNTAAALKTDRWRSSHPLVRSVTNLSDINYVFPHAPFSSVIIYEKSAAVFYMISTIMGKEKFDKALRNYLIKYAFQTVEPDDLFAEFDKVVTDDQLGPDGKRLSIANFAHQWSLQMGFPLVTLGEFNSTHCEITEQRYVLEEGTEDPGYANNSYGYKWDVPIWLKREDNNSSEFYWLPANGHLVITCTKEEAIILNHHANYYVSDYSVSGYQNIIRLLNNTNTDDLTKKKMTLDIEQLHQDGRIDKDIYGNLHAILSRD